MDATVQQRDGFRFMYVLPFAEDRVLVEDTTYSDSPELDSELSRREILNYAEQQGLVVRDCVREERGVLPLPTTMLPTRPAANAPLRAGYGGGYFHPTTGYSLPVALRLAEHVAQRWPGPLLDSAFDELFTQHQKQFRYCLWLNRLLFGGFAPERRYEVLARFYRLPTATIARFYALNTTGLDRARILCGRPPRGFSAHRLLFARGHHA
jgi:lycopene beta-cyclase